MNHTEVGKIKGKINTQVFSRYFNIVRNNANGISTWLILNGCFAIRIPLQRAIADTRYLDKINKPQR